MTLEYTPIVPLGTLPYLSNCIYNMYLIIPPQIKVKTLVMSYSE